MDGGTADAAASAIQSWRPWEHSTGPWTERAWPSGTRRRPRGQWGLARDLSRRVRAARGGGGGGGERGRAGRQREGRTHHSGTLCRSLNARRRLRRVPRSITVPGRGRTRSQNRPSVWCWLSRTPVPPTLTKPSSSNNPSIIRKAPRPPVALGVKVMRNVQLAPAARLVGQSFVKAKSCH